MIVAALSGGVDSATAAALLVEQGHRVVGMTMRLYDARGTAASAGGRCCGPRDVEDARAVSAHLGIPFYVVDLAAEFGAAVVDDFVEAYLAGETPNLCGATSTSSSRRSSARAIGADVLATGHYADRRRRAAAARHRQGPVVLPVLDAGARPARALARRDDQGRGPRACRAPRPAERAQAGVAGDLLRLDATTPASSRRAARRRKPVAGNIVGEDGTVLGRHDGTHRFTVGQHRASATSRRRTSSTSPRSTRRAPRSGSGRARPPSAASSRSATCAGWRRGAPARGRDPGPPPRRTDRGADRGHRRSGARAAAEATVAAGAAVIYDGDRARPAAGWSEET